MNLLWNILGKPLAAVGGRSFDDMRGRSAGDCDKSVAVGLMCLVSVAIIFAGHWLFWRNFPHVADIALTVAACIAVLFAVMYRVALRCIETMGGLGKTLMLGTLLALMGVNAMLAGHELVLLAFSPQVEAQAILGAARGVTAYATAVETSLGLPQLRNNSNELDKAVAAAQAERGRIPDLVQQLQQQGRACDAKAAQLQSRIPPELDDPGRAAAWSNWREQRARCSALANQAGAALAQHLAQADKQLASLGQSRGKVRTLLDEANTQHEDTLKRDTPTLTASATTGFARHNALWAAVAAGTIPAWAAFGLMFGVLALDGFSFLIKLLARDDAATTDRIQAAGTDGIYNHLHAVMLRQQRSLTRQATGAPVPSMLGRLARMVGAMRRRQGGVAAGAPGVRAVA